MFSHVQLKPRSHYMTFKVVRSLHCSHCTTCCFVFKSLWFSHCMTDRQKGDTCHKNFCQEDSLMSMSGVQTTFCCKVTWKNWHGKLRSTLLVVTFVNVIGMHVQKHTSLPFIYFPLSAITTFMCVADATRSTHSYRWPLHQVATQPLLLLSHSL